MAVPITMAAAGAAALINLWLAIRIGIFRTQHRILIGDGNNKGLIARMRAQSNFVEYTPFVLILLGGLELQDGPSLWLWSVAAIYLVARIAHGVGMTMEYPNPFRKFGTIVTMLTLLGLGLYGASMPYRSVPAPYNIGREG